MVQQPSRKPPATKFGSADLLTLGIPAALFLLLLLLGGTGGGPREMKDRE
jgi:hypothetical protein